MTLSNTEPDTKRTGDQKNILRSKQLKQQPRIQQMLPLRTPLIPKHHLLHQIRTNRARIAHHLPRDLQRARQHIVAVLHRLSEESAPHRGVAGQVRGAGGDGAHGARVPDQARQEVGGARFHDEPAPREHEADF